MKPYELRRAIRNSAVCHGYASAKEWGRLLDFAAAKVVLDLGITAHASLMTPSYAHHGVPFYLAKAKWWNAIDMRGELEVETPEYIEFYPHDYKIGNGKIRIRFSAAFEQNILVIWPKYYVSCTGD